MMTLSLSLPMLLALCLLLQCIPAANSQPPTLSQTYFAAATLRGSAYASQILGVALFYQPSGPNTETYIRIQLSTALPAGSYALHVHEAGDETSQIGGGNILTTVAGVSTHFNPYGSLHGCDATGTGLDKFSKHVGDIGNFTQDAKGTMIEFISNLIDLSYSNRSIIGRSINLHVTFDNCGPPTGNAGFPIVSGVIGIGNPLNYYFDPDIAGGVPTNTTRNLASLPLVYDDGNVDPAVQYGPPTSAVAVMMPIGNASAIGQQQAQGVVRFAMLPEGGNASVYITLVGLAPNTGHAIHVHLYGDDFDSSVTPYSTSSSHFVNAGGHWNPYSKDHGIPPNPDRHAGDLGSFQTDALGSVNYSITNIDLIDLLHWNTSIIGRAVIVHAMNDTGGQPTGDAGDRILAGIIGVSQRSVTANLETNFAPWPVQGFNPSSLSSSSSSTASSISSSSSSSSSASPPINPTDNDGSSSSVIIAIVIILIVLLSVCAGMYVRFSRATYQQTCFCLDIKGCLQFFTGGQDSNQPHRLMAEDSQHSYGAV